LDAAVATIESWQQDYISLPVSQFLLSLRPTESARLDIPDVERQLRLWAETRNLLDIGVL
jgi:L-aspartate oxidase